MRIARRLSLLKRSGIVSCTSTYMNQHIDVGMSSLIDFIFTDEAMQVSDIVHHAPLGNSDHSVISFKFHSHQTERMILLWESWFSSHQNQNQLAETNGTSVSGKPLWNKNWNDTYRKTSAERYTPKKLIDAGWREKPHWCPNCTSRLH